MESQYDDLILWVTPLGKVTNTAWLINAPIDRFTTMDGYFATYPRIISEMRSTIRVESVRTLPVRVTVPPNTVMEGDTLVFPGIDEDFRATITVSTNETLAARIEMALFNQMEGDVQAFGGDRSEMHSFIKVSTHDTLTSRIKLRPLNRMAGMLELFPIPRINVVKYPNKDSFIRDDLPRINYGSLPTMDMGRTETPYSQGQLATFNSVIGFDFSDLPDGAVVEKAELVLTVAQYKEVMKYFIELLDSPWQESTIAWSNKPATSEGRLVEDAGSGSVVRLDILSFVKRWVEREDRIPNHGIQLTLKDVSDTWSFFTKEYSVVGDRPRLEMRYYDRDLSFSADSRNLEARIRVSRTEVSNLRGRIKIVSIQGSDEMHGRIVVENERDLASRIKVTREELNSTIIVRRTEPSDLPARIPIVGAGESELKSTIIVSKESLPSTIIVAEEDKLNSTIQVMAHEYLNATGVLSKEFMQGTITIAESDDLPSSIVVQRTESSTLPVKLLSATSKNLNANIRVAVSDTLDASILVQQEMSRRIPAIIRVERNSESDMKGTIKVVYEADLNATIQVNSDVLPSVVSLSEEGESTVRATITVDDSNYRSNMVASITVGHWEELPSTIRVTSDFLPSTISVPGVDGANLPATIQVAQFLVSEMISFIEVGNPRHLKSRIIVEAAEDTDTGYVFMF